MPLVKRHGAAVIALPNDEFEIPEQPERRLKLARKIVEVAATNYGIAKEDIVLDPLAMPIGADTSLVVRTLDTISLIATQLGTNMALGASNVSFGMPDRVPSARHFWPWRCAAGSRAPSWTPARPSSCAR